MAPTVSQTLAHFSERDQVPESLSILTYTEEEQEGVQEYLSDDWGEEDSAEASRTRKSSIESIWSVCSPPLSFSVLGVCTTPTAAKKVSPRRVTSPLRRFSCPQLMALRELPDERSVSGVPSVSPQYRPSELGIGLASTVGNPRGADASS
jgi:hypothetical protein